MGHPFLFGLVVIVLMTIAISMLIPRDWLATCAVTVGMLSAGLWGFVAIIVSGLQHLD